MITVHAHSSIEDALVARDLKAAKKTRKKFLKIFPEGFYDGTYKAWERDFKFDTHERWLKELSSPQFRKLLKAEQFHEIANTATRIESRTQLLFSFEKIALKDAIRSLEGANAFSIGLYNFLYGAGTIEQRFDKWLKVIHSLPRLQTRVLTWPIATIFGFIARPDIFIYVKPMVTRVAFEEYGFDFQYESTPTGAKYEEILQCAQTIAHDLADLRPRDMIDIQSFIWVAGSMEYE